MSTFGDVSRRVDDVTAPTPDLDALVAAGERRLRRRRAVAALAASAVVVVLVVAGLLVNGVDEQTDAPVDRPIQHQKVGPQLTAHPVRDIVYSDLRRVPSGLRGSTVHLGKHVVKTGSGFVHLDVTDNGFAYTTRDARVWTSDGGRPRLVGRLCQASLGRTPDDVLSANAGSRLTWLDCTGAHHPELVVLDTSTGRELVRRPLLRCSAAASMGCMPNALIGEHLFLTRWFARHGGTGVVVAQGLLFDLGTGHVTEVTRPYVERGGLLDSPAYVEDLRTHPRGLVIGSSWEAGAPTDGIRQLFEVVGSQLVPVQDGPTGQSRHRARAFDTATGRVIHLRVPPGYHGATGFDVFEWLDDDTVALDAGGGGWPEDAAAGYGDILRCRLSTGRCVLVVRGHGSGEHADVRVVPSLGLPG